MPTVTSTSVDPTKPPAYTPPTTSSLTPAVNPSTAYKAPTIAPTADDKPPDASTYQIADLTPDEGTALEEAFARNGLALVYLAAPTSSDERIELIASRASGFVYCVSLTGVTGARSSGPSNLDSLVARIKAKAALPVAVGFGVSRPEHVRNHGGARKE